ncbi:predicted protein [Coccidioides posadasii str. Silveira]|uniref:Predicted protein n=1 Tax=Coccidioides posadasii (strain RMSCC 757 / Silveira) TaxID=443226 RepID=E9D307_COCPS|nr:predicted protein [Coccidioides posadasii str. Silveira]
MDRPYPYAWVEVISRDQGKRSPDGPNPNLPYGEVRFATACPVENTPARPFYHSQENLTAHLRSTEYPVIFMPDDDVKDRNTFVQAFSKECISEIEADHKAALLRYPNSCDSQSTLPGPPQSPPSIPNHSLSVLRE